MNYSKRQLFRLAVDIFDGINIWIEDKFNLNPKRKLLEKQQDMISVEELEQTIGKELKITKT
jgi:hypothetical protein